MLMNFTAVPSGSEFFKPSYMSQEQMTLMQMAQLHNYYARVQSMFNSGLVKYELDSKIASSQYSIGNQLHTAAAAQHWQAGR